MTAPEPRYGVSLSARALRDLEAVRVYITEQGSPVAARQMAARLEAAILSLSEHPDRGRPIGPALRELTTVRPFIVRYRVRANTVEIVRIRHGAQRADG